MIFNHTHDQMWSWMHSNLNMCIHPWKRYTNLNYLEVFIYMSFDPVLPDLQPIPQNAAATRRRPETNVFSALAGKPTWSQKVWLTLAVRSNRLPLIPLGSWGLPKRVTTVKNWSRGISMPIDDTFDTWSKLQFLYVKVSARAARGTNDGSRPKIGHIFEYQQVYSAHIRYMCICKQTHIYHVYVYVCIYIV